MKSKALILVALLMLTSTQAFAAPFADIANIDTPQLVAMDDYDDDDYDDGDDYDDDPDYGDDDDDDY